MSKIGAKETGNTPSLVEDFGKLVTGFNRFLSMLAAAPVFKKSGLSLSEWAALAILHEADGINNKQLAVRLGVTRQRAHQLIAHLAEAHLVVVDTSPTDSRENVVRMAPWGRKQLAAVDEALEEIIHTALGPRTHIVSRMRRQSALLLKIAKTARTEGTPPPPKSRPQKSESAANDPRPRPAEPRWPTPFRREA